MDSWSTSVTQQNGGGIDARGRTTTYTSPIISRTSSSSIRGLHYSNLREKGLSKEGRPLTGTPYRVVIVGASGVGKTENVYSYQCTIDDDDVMLDVMDTAGQAEEHLTDYYATWGDCYVWLYSITNRQSLDRLSCLHDHFMRRRRQGACVHVLLGNKTDLAHERQVRALDGRSLARAWDCPFYEISVAEADHMCMIADIFHNLVRRGRQLGLLDCQQKKNSSAAGKFRHAIQKVMMGSKMSPKIYKKSSIS